jgi:restriction endonuclease Mrr
LFRGKVSFVLLNETLMFKAVRKSLSGYSSWSKPPTNGNWQPQQQWANRQQGGEAWQPRTPSWQQRNPSEPVAARQYWNRNDQPSWNGQQSAHSGYAPAAQRKSYPGRSQQFGSYQTLALLTEDNVRVRLLVDATKNPESVVLSLESQSGKKAYQMNKELVKSFLESYQSTRPVTLATSQNVTAKVGSTEGKVFLQLQSEDGATLSASVTTNQSKLMESFLNLVCE